MTRRIWRQRWPWALCVLLLLAAILVCWFPARWAWAWVGNRLPEARIAAVHGSIWDGRVDWLSVSGVRFGRLDWRLGRSALWGNVHVAFDLHGPLLMADGHIRRLGDGSMVLEQTHFRLPLAALPLTWPDRDPLGGVLTGQVQHAHLVGGWPATLAATVWWRDAQVTEDGKRLDLGSFVTRWHAGPGAALHAQLRDAGGAAPVRLRGTFTLTPIRWQLDATLQARANHADLRRLLQTLGRADPDGTVHVQRHANLTWENVLQ